MNYWLNQKEVKSHRIVLPDGTIKHMKFQSFKKDHLYSNLVEYCRMWKKCQKDHIQND